MFIYSEQGEQRTFIVEGFATVGFITDDCIKIDEENNTLILNLEHGSPIIEVMCTMMSLPRLFDIIILSGANNVVSFKKCAFVIPSSMFYQFSLKFVEVIFHKLLVTS